MKTNVQKIIKNVHWLLKKGVAYKLIKLKESRKCLKSAKWEYLFQYYFSLACLQILDYDEKSCQGQTYWISSITWHPVPWKVPTLGSIILAPKCNTRVEVTDSENHTRLLLICLDWPKSLPLKGPH